MGGRALVSDGRLSDERPREQLDHHAQVGALVRAVEDAHRAREARQRPLITNRRQPRQVGHRRLAALQPQHGGRRGRHVEHDGAARRGHRDAQWARAECAAWRLGKDEADEALLGDGLEVVAEGTDGRARVARAHQPDAVVLRLVDGRLHSIAHHEHPVLLLAVHPGRELRLDLEAHHARARRARHAAVDHLLQIRLVVAQLAPHDHVHEHVRLRPTVPLGDDRLSRDLVQVCDRYAHARMRHPARMQRPRASSRE
eukprot:6845488-Prymnesium_polylepis.2